MDVPLSGGLRGLFKELITAVASRQHALPFPSLLFSGEKDILAA
jgi:hypothetical protein